MSLARLGEAIENPSVTQIMAMYPSKKVFDAAARQGKIKPTTEAGVVANIYNRIVNEALAQQAQTDTTVFEDNTQSAPQMGLAAAQQMQGQPQAPGQGIDQIPVPDQMFAPQGMAGGGIVAFQSAGFVTDKILRMMNGQERAEYQRTGKIPERLQLMMEPEVLDRETARFSRQGTGVPMSSEGLAAQGFTPPAAPFAPPRGASNLPSTAQTAAQQAAVQQATTPLGLEQQFAQDYAMIQRVLGEDPTRAKLKELYEKQEKAAEEDARKDQAMRLIEAGLGIAGGTSPYFAANLAGATPALKGYGEDIRARRKEATERAKGMAELEGMTRKEKAEVLGRTMAERREDKKTREKQEFDERVLNKKIEAEKEIAGMKSTKSASEYIGNLLRSKDPADREVGKQLLGSSKSGEMTTAKAIELVLEGNPSLGMPGKEKELEAAVQRYMNLSRSRNFAGFSSRQLD